MLDTVGPSLLVVGAISVWSAVADVLGRACSA